MPNSEEIGAKEALEMIISGQIGELLFRRIKVEPDWADVHWRAVDTLRDRGAKTEVLCSDGEWRPYVGFVGSAKKLGELGMGNNLRYRVDQNTIPIKVREEPVFTSSPTATVSIETGPVQVHKGDAIAVKFVDCKATVDVKRKASEPSLRAKVDPRVSAVCFGQMYAASPKDWLFALIDVLDEERAQSGQSRPVGKDRGIE